MLVEKKATITFKLTLPDGYPQHMQDELFDVLADSLVEEMQKKQNHMQRCIVISCKQCDVKLE